MKLQTGVASCGAAALANALAALGFVLGEDAVAAAAGTDGDGTGIRGLKRAARALGASVDVISERDGVAAYYRLRGHLDAGEAAVLCFDAGKHWVTAVGLLGGLVLVVDPAMTVRDMLSPMGMEDLLAYWTSGDSRRPRYALVLSEKED